RKLAKGLSFNRIKNIDQIIVAQPEFVTGELNLVQKMKLKLFRKNIPEYLGPIFSQASTENDAVLLGKFNVTKGRYLLINAGGRGNSLTTEKGVTYASDLFLELARELTREIDFEIIVVM